MTTGELVAQEAIDTGFWPKIALGLVSPLNNALESVQQLMETVQGPMQEVAKLHETFNLMAEVLRPQMETISKISFPTIPSPFLNELLSNEEDHALLTPQMFRTVQEVRIVNPEDIVTATRKKVNEFTTTSYPLPQHAVWESLSIKFIDGHVLRVIYPNMEPKKFDFKEMGFFNGKTNRPDLKWTLLRIMAENGGALINDKWDRRFNRNVKYELNERLREFFSMKDNPIPHYNKRDGYHARFTLLGEN